MKTAIVTGAGTGIGRAAAIGLAGAGWTVACMGRRAAPLEETLALLPGDGHMAVATDVSDAVSVRDGFARVSEQFGRLDLLFNNAGTGAPSVPLDEADPADLIGVMASNATGSLLCARAAFALMRHQTPQGGRILNNGSVSAHAPRPNMAAYTMAKHAITGLTKSLTLDGRAFSIVASQIDIGNAASERTQRMADGILQADGSVASEQRMALDHVVGAILHMASLPLDANIPFLTIMAATMPLYGRG